MTPTTTAVWWCVVAIELPGPVADFLSFIGISWPNVNEDKVRAFGTHVSQFTTELRSTHDDATRTITQLEQAYSGQSYEALLAAWGELSSSHMTELIDACTVVADAMPVAAEVIVGMKLAAIAQLVVLAAEFIADQAAAVATFGLAEAGLFLIEEEGQQVVRFLEQELIQYVEGQVINAAVGPLINQVASAVSGLVYQGTADVLGVSNDSFSLDPDGVASVVSTLHSQADAFSSQAQTFAATASAMTFT